RASDGFLARRLHGDAAKLRRLVRSQPARSQVGRFSVAVEKLFLSLVPFAVLGRCTRVGEPQVVQHALFEHFLGERRAVSPPPLTEPAAGVGRSPVWPAFLASGGRFSWPSPLPSHVPSLAFS